MKWIGFPVLHIICLAGSFNIGAQVNYINKLFDDTILNAYGYGSDIRFIDSHYSFVTQKYWIGTFDSVSYWSLGCIGVIDIDEFGNIIKEKRIIDLPNGYEVTYNGRIKAIDGTYIITGGYFDSLKFEGVIPNGLLIRTDKTGEPIWIKDYGSVPDFEIFRSVAQMDNGNLIAVGQSRANQSFAIPWRVITDSAGNLLSSQTWGGGAAGDALNIQAVSDGFLMSGYLGNSIFVYKLNELGSVVWQKYIPFPKHSAAWGAKELLDGTYLLYGYRSLTFNKYDAYLAKLDPQQNGKIIWEKTFGHPAKNDGFIDIHQLGSDTIYLAGITRVDSISTQGIGWLLAIDNNGDSLFSRYYYPQNTQLRSELFFMNPASDGGFVMGGYGFNMNNKQNPWLVKTDRLGYTCNPSNCDSVGFGVGISRPTLPPAGQVQVYPNPLVSTGVLHINGLDVRHSGERVLLDFLSPDGRLVQRIMGHTGMVMPTGSVQLPITRGRLPSGLYLLKAWDGKEKLYGTVKVMVE